MFEAVISITSRCNLHCPFCSGRLGHFKREEDLPISEWSRFFQELENNHYFYVKLTGAGEPFLRPDILDICRFIASSHMRFRIYSNGTLITPEIAHALAETKRCDYIRISLDSTQAIHNASRGAGSYERARQGIQALLAENIHVRIHSTITRPAIGTLAPFLTELSELGVQDFSNTFVIPTRDHQDYFKEQKFLSAQDVAASLREHRDLPPHLHSLIRGSASLVLWKRWLRWLKNPQKFPLISREYRQVHCPRAENDVTVSTNGFFIPCFYHGDIKLGKINEISITEAQNRLKQLVRSFHIEPDSDCRDCSFLPVCGYGCKGRQIFCLKEILPYLEQENFKDWPMPEELFQCWAGR